jgi:hypothetical protein
MKKVTLILAAVVMLAISAFADDRASGGATNNAVAAGEQIKWQVIAGGGQRGTSTNYVLNGTVGQAAAGPGSSTNFKLNGGFWQNFTPPTCCIGIRGNIDCDGLQSIDIGDLTILVDHLFISFTPLCCVDEGDMVVDASVDIADLTFLVDHLFISFVAQPGC